MNNTIDQFMWGYQSHFASSAERFAEKLFGQLDPKLFSNVSLLGFLQDEIENRHAICVEPEDCGYTQKTFSNTIELAAQLLKVDPGKSLFHSHPIAQKNHNIRLQYNSMRKSIKECIAGNYFSQNLATFVSTPIRRDGYMVFIILQLDQEAIGAYPQLKIKTDGTFTFSTSLIEATASAFLDLMLSELQAEDAGSGLFLSDIQMESSLKGAASAFTNSIALKAKSTYGAHGVFDGCNTISSLRYEGEDGIGRIAIAPKSHPNIKMRIELKTPIRFSEYVKVRKFLQLSDEDLLLITDGHEIFGLGSIVGEYNPNREDLITISITGHHQWEVCHDSKCLMRISYGQPQLAKDAIERTTFCGDLKRIFTDITDHSLKLIWEFVTEAAKQKHGTMVVISSEAEREAKRLGKQAFSITPATINPDLIQGITSIDGAVLMSPECVCHAVGVILDGVASINGDSSRGARYNSAIRYFDSNQDKGCCLIVISEDGMINVIPNLMPLIRKSTLDQKIEELEALQDINKSGFYKNFNRTITWLEDHEFYLSEEQCDFTNKLRKAIEKKVKKYDAQQEHPSIRITRRDLKPNELMDESYFLK